MALEIHHGAPNDIERRQPREQRVYQLLSQLGIDFDRLDHEPAMTMEVCAEIDRAFSRTPLDVFDPDNPEGPIICKNLFLCNRPRTHFFLLMMPGQKPFHTRDITSQIPCGRLSFATSDDMLKMLDTLPGSVSVMSLMNDPENKVNLLIDNDVIKSTYIGCHPCANTSSLRLLTSDLLNKILPAISHKPQFVTL